MIPRNPPRLLVGPPGVGKTAFVRRSYDYTEVLTLSSATEEDLTGLPWRDGVYERRTMPGPFRRLRDAAENKLRTCLFLDELDKARREVADTLLTLVESHRLGEWELPADCEIYAAANPPEWGGGAGISEAMQTRFAIHYYEPDLEEWAEWLVAAYPGRLAENVSRGVLEGRVPLFERTGEGLGLRLTCPRTWELAFRSCMNSKNKKTVEADIRGLLTTNAAMFMLDLLRAEEAGSRTHDTEETYLSTRARAVAMAAKRRGNVRKVTPIGL